MAAPGDSGIGILDRGDHPGDSRRDDRIRAGRRHAVMRAGLQGHIEGRAARGLAGLVDRPALGVRAAAGLRDAAADDDVRL